MSSTESTIPNIFKTYFCPRLYNLEIPLQFLTTGLRLRNLHTAVSTKQNGATRTEFSLNMWLPIPSFSVNQTDRIKIHTQHATHINFRKINEFP